DAPTSGAAGGGRIVVPFPYQSARSGIGDPAVHEVVWYARDFDVPADWAGDDVLLHFGAVDFRATVWINGQEAGHNRGGHVPFSLDATPYLRAPGGAHDVPHRPAGPNRLVLRVEDRQDAHQPRGKQAVSGRPGGIDYHCSTGVWQSVWLEPVPVLRIDHLTIATDPEAETIELQISLHAPATGYDLEAEALDGDPDAPGAVVATGRVRTAGGAARLRLHIPGARRWSPDAPHLYGLRLRLLQQGRVLDQVDSYAGIRSVTLRDGRVHLNGRPLYLIMALDQGYWPDGLYTAPSDEALRADVVWAKRLGFDGVRKHQKVEDPRWLYWCDRLGLLVWGEMPNARAWSAEAEELLLAEWERAIARDANHPCIVTWVPVNESMGFPGLEAHHPGQYAFLERVVATTRRLDPHRPVIDNDGWEHTDVTDVVAIHDYTPDAAGLRARYRETLAGGPLPPTVWWRGKPLFLRGARHRGQPVMLTEVGGFLQRPAGAPADALDRLFGVYATFGGGDELLARYADLLQGLADLPFLAGFCYTQLYDVAQEVNGLLTAGRRPKVDPERVAALNRDLRQRLEAGAGRPPLSR
ncbi:MAG TPA: glycoside hydrolase family 2 TIM barrel-domain containing protein, partial [Chloroflexota bacterium]|nr:glycoside hydrolase family 2 TIM barrel-domain containing protein [Chloroflexota bacterium]